MQMGGISTNTAPGAPLGTVGHAAEDRGFSVVARLLLAAALMFSVLISGSDSGRLVMPIRLAGALIGSVLILYYIRNATRRHDRVDRLALGGLVLFLVTCALSSVPRLSFEAATTALAYVAAFYVARDVVRDDPGRLLTIAVLGFLGTAVAVTVLILWSVVWVQWLSVPGAGAPPFDLVLPSVQYYPVSAAMLVGFLLPATISLVRRPLIWPIGVIGVVASLAIIVMSGSRSLWIGVVAALVMFWLSEVGWTRRVRGSLIIGAWALGAAIAVATMPQLAARVLAGSSVDLRLAMWTDSLRIWLDSPLTGHGPGSYASALSMSGFYNSFATYIDHAHSLPVQVLVEGGLVGVVGIGLLAVAVISGRGPELPGASAAASALTLFLVLSVTADPAVDAFFVMPLIIWAAILAPRAAPDIVRRPLPSLRVATVATAAVVAIATGATHAAAWSRDQAALEQGEGNLIGAVDHLSSAVAMDPSNALYRRELGVSLLAAGDASTATRELETAVRLNGGDMASLRALALARLADGDEAGAIEAAGEALGRADLHPVNGLTVAYVGEAVGQPELVHHGMVRAVRAAPWILAAAEWDTVFPETSDAEVLEGARESWVGSAALSYRNDRARAWLAGIADVELPPDAEPAAAAEAALLRCRPDLAAAALDRQSTAGATSQASLQAKLMLERVLGREPEPDLVTLMSLHDRNLWRLAFEGVSGGSPFVDYFADVTMYGSAPMATGDDLVFPTEPSGLSAWLRDPIAAATAGAPNSPLSRCR